MQGEVGSLFNSVFFFFFFKFSANKNKTIYFRHIILNSIGRHDSDQSLFSAVLLLRLSILFQGTC